MRAMAVLVTALLLAVAGCSSASDEIAERIAEQGEGVSNVDIEDDSVSFDVETDEGSASVDIGSGDIPDDFPAPIPSGGEVTFSMITEGGGSSGSTVALTYPDDRFDELVSTWEGWLESEGYEVSKSEATSGGRRSVILTGNRESGDPSGVAMTVAEDGSGSVQATVQVGSG